MITVYDLRKTKYTAIILNRSRQNSTPALARPDVSQWRWGYILRSPITR
jgi:hypothetical protein